MDKITSIRDTSNKDTKNTSQTEKGERTEPKVEIVGVRVMGNVDPRGLTRQEFQSLPEKVYHGHGTEGGMRYDPNYDYDSDEFVEVNQSSATLGQGLYATDSLSEAQNYSVMRISRSASENPNIPTVIETLVPYQAKMLDLRSKADLNENGLFPREVADSWKSYYLSFMEYLEENISQQSGSNSSKIPEVYKYFYKNGLFGRYQELIDEVISSGRLDLRNLLGTGSSEGFSNSFSDLGYPPWMPLFSEFMKKSGFDGVVYNESGDASHFGRAPSYVFYNLNKVGTYDSWQSGTHSLE